MQNHLREALEWVHQRGYFPISSNILYRSIILSQRPYTEAPYYWSIWKCLGSIGIYYYECTKNIELLQQNTAYFTL